MVWIENHVGVGHVKQYKDNHRWSVTKISEIRYILEGVIPYLVLKTHQAFLALESCDSTELSQERRMEIHQELKELKRRE